MFMPSFIVMSLRVIWIYCIGALQQKRRGQCCDEIQWLLGLVKQKMKKDTLTRGWEMEKWCHFNKRFWHIHSTYPRARCSSASSQENRKYMHHSSPVNKELKSCQQVIVWTVAWYCQHQLLYLKDISYSLQYCCFKWHNKSYSTGKYEKDASAFLRLCIIYC